MCERADLQARLSRQESRSLVAIEASATCRRGCDQEPQRRIRRSTVRRSPKRLQLDHADCIHERRSAILIAHDDWYAPSFEVKRRSVRITSSGLEELKELRYRS
jgi:hypothetical protein